MPHIVVEATRKIHACVDWRKVFIAIHIELASQGFGNLSDFKSRVVLSSDWVVADKEGPCEVLFATLHTMNPRPEPVLAAMMQIVHRHLSEQAAGDFDGAWVQCCVRAQSTPRALYIKTHTSAPNDLEAQFNYPAQPVSA